MNYPSQTFFCNVVFFFSIILLASCTYQAAPHQPTLEDTSPALFRDADVDKAELQLALQVEPLSGSESVASEAVTLGELPTLESTLAAQAVLPDASGFVYYIEHDATNLAAPFKLFSHDQGKDISLKIFEGQREIQAVAGSADGNTVLVSMRESIHTTSDFEIFRLRINPARLQRLSSNTVDDRDVSLSADGLKLVWEQPISGQATLVLRTYQDTSTITGFTENILTASFPQRQPSLSGNGRFIVLVRDGNSNADFVVRFDTVTNSYLTVAGSSTSTLEHPSISNDGNKTLYLQGRPVGNDLITLRNISAATTQTVVNSPTLEHPFLSPDAQFLTYGALEAGSIKVFSKSLVTLQQLRLTNPTSPVNHLGVSWQMPFASQQKVVPNTGQDFSFGRAIAMNGPLMVVGGIGQVYLLSRDSFGTWTVFKTLTPSDGEFFDDFFGSAVAISGDTVVVGAFSKARDLDGDGRISRTFEGDVGAAYIFERNVGGADNWGEVKKLVHTNASRGDSFGFSVAVSGDVVAIGARARFNVQPVRLFGRNQGGVNNWGEIKELRSSGNFGFYGFSLAMSGDTLVVGSPAEGIDTNNDGTIDAHPGAAYIFQKNQGGTDNWGEVKRFTSSDFASSDSFGSSVAISGNIVVVGAEGEDHDTTNDGVDEGDPGAAYVFARNRGGTNNWGEVKKLMAKDGEFDDQFGNSVGISGDTVVVGAFVKKRDINRDGIIEEQVGAAYVFARNEGGTDNWGELKKLLAADGEEDVFYGRAVAVNGNSVVVGADGEGNNQEGAVYVDER